ncbi:YtpI family protein [Paenibacillus alvei]|uniref:YtpI family protein n=1 Tax=Paenibacillus alvei TaxID=44250 RepID=A0AAP7DK10_PAEAL|nr:YtpI family protein [Paenibacillus alvei]MBG9737058.1 hypothetical protein [Paenibacillus alvei]MBG9742831.1 hypothetical protein [Paenibacillus alvei]MCY9579748.1 YtpI family protein [Paenibacillus alvei]MCY9586401.1 YtpI family protein [Paenibacillus alvei]MCY9762159.1 YtpI family protein [Paenibacillus alvei]
METIQWVLIILICMTSGMSVYFSFRSRREQATALRGLYAAKMNICMGFMLLFIASIQIFMFTASTVRVIVGAVLLVIGLFNLFAGIRNHSHYQAIYSAGKK